MVLNPGFASFLVRIDPLETLAQLVAIPSVNPMGRDDAGSQYYEARLAAYLELLLQGAGLHVTRHLVAPQRPNLLAHLPGSQPPEEGGALVLLDAHLDTVPVEGMTVEPWTPVVRQGRLYGRGACDVKGGMAAMVAAVVRLAEERPVERPTVWLSLTVNEECGFDGARAMSRLWTSGHHPLAPRRPDWAVVAEPTDLRVVVAHKGVTRWRCHCHGRAAHASAPARGENAIYRMAEVLQAIERYQAEVIAGLGLHPRCGPGTVSVGTIQGGVSVNTVPDRATIEIDRRLRPGETPEEAREHLVAYIAAQVAQADAVEHEPIYMAGPPLSDEHNGPLAERLVALSREVADEGETTVAAYATNAAFFAEAGVPTVVFGPGSIEQAHTADEWISLDQVEQSAEIYYRLLREL